MSDRDETAGGSVTDGYKAELPDGVSGVSDGSSQRVVEDRGGLGEGHAVLFLVLAIFIRVPF